MPCLRTFLEATWRQEEDLHFSITKQYIYDQLAIMASLINHDLVSFVKRDDYMPSSKAGLSEQGDLKLSNLLRNLQY